MKASTYQLPHHEDEFIEYMRKPKRPFVTDMSAFEAIELRIDMQNGLRSPELEPYSIDGSSWYLDDNVARLKKIVNA